MTIPWFDVPAAGLTSGGVQKAGARGTPVDDSRDYYSSGVLPHRPSRYPNYEPPASLRTSDIRGAKPRSHPITTTSETTTPFPSIRCTVPLKPQYQILGAASMLRHSANAEGSGSNVFSNRSPSRARPSTSLDTSDIQGARPFLSMNLHRGDWAKFTDRSDVNDITGRNLRSSQQQRTLSSLNTSDIKGASAPRGTRSEILSPGRGTLLCSDIVGTSTGCMKAQVGTSASSLRSTFMLGRVPAPSSYSFEFSQQPRRTVLSKPTPSAD